MLETLQEIRLDGQRLLLTEQLAECYQTTGKRISENFKRNEEKYIEHKHYIRLEGAQLESFLQSANCGLQNPGKIRTLYLWTERGALLHAKSLNTDKAWDVYDWLVDFYFRAKTVGRVKGEALYCLRNEPIIPLEDFFEITKPDKNIRKLFFRDEFFRVGTDWNGMGKDLKADFERKYNRKFGEDEVLFYLRYSGVQKALQFIKLDAEAERRLGEYFPQRQADEEFLRKLKDRIMKFR